MGLSLLLLALVLFGASQGALKISFDALFDEEYRDIWLNIRLPRVLLAVLVGAALATAGVIMQGLFRNPMADPGLLGVSSGSALMVGVAIVLPFSFPVVLVLYEQMVFAIAGSLVVCTIIFLITQRHRDGSMMQLLLAGIAINALCGAAIGILSYIGDEQQLRQLTLWMMGNLGQAQWPTLLVASSFILPAIIATTCLAGTLNLLQLGDEEAHYLGVNVKLENQEWKTFLDTRHQGTFDVARAGWCADYNEPTSFLNTMLSDSSNNTAHYKSPAFDKLIGETLKVADDAQRADLYAKSEQQLDKDSAIVPVYYYVNARLVKPWVGGYTGKDPLDNISVKNLYIIKH